MKRAESLDGSAHDAPMADKHDEIRTKFLEEQGVTFPAPIRGGERGNTKKPRRYYILEAFL